MKHLKIRITLNQKQLMNVKRQIYDFIKRYWAMNTCIAYAFFSYHEPGCVPQAEPPARNTPYRGQCRIQGI